MRLWSPRAPEKTFAPAGLPVVSAHDMAEHEEISRLITAVFAAWQEAKINFLILRNYEDLPRYTTNDIDVLVQKDERKEAEKILLDTANAQDFRLHNRAQFATLALYFS